MTCPFLESAKVVILSPEIKLQSLGTQALYSRLERTCGSALCLSTRSAQEREKERREREKEERERERGEKTEERGRKEERNRGLPLGNPKT